LKPLQRRKPAGKLVNLAEFLRKIIFWSLFFLFGMVLTLFVVSRWVQTEQGAAALSHWVTAQVQKSVPETKVVIESLHWKGFGTLTSPRIRWLSLDDEPILAVKDLQVSLSPIGWILGHPEWEVCAALSGLDLARLDEKLNRGEWMTQGILTGYFKVVGLGREVEEVNLDLDSEGGGTVSAKLLGRLVEMMPDGENKNLLRQLLQSKTTFDYRVGWLDFVTEEDRYKIHLLMDGDHLLNITIRISKGSLKILNTLKEGMR